MEDIPIEESVSGFFNRYRDHGYDDFRYGFGRNEPYSTFLFEIQPNFDFPLFSSDWRVNHNDIPSNPYIDRKISKILANVPEIHKAAAITMLYATAETMIERISVNEWQCILCMESMPLEETIQHIIEFHCPQLLEKYNDQISILDDDSDNVNNMISKLQFDAAITQPSVCFPVTKFPEEFSAAPSFNMQRLLNTTNEFNEKFKGNSGKYDKYKRNLNEMPISPPIVSLLSKRGDAFTKLIHCSPIPKDLNIQNIQWAESLLTSLYNSFTVPFQAKITSIINDMPMISTESNEMIATAEIAPLPKQHIPREASISALDELTKEEMLEKKKPKKKPSKRIPFIETIPVDIRDSSIATSANLIINNYIRTNIVQLVDRVLQEKKKGLRTEKAKRQREEEKQKLQAYKNRRQQVIDKFSQQIAQPIIHSFIYNEIAGIYEDEIKTTKRETIEIPSTGSTPSSIVLTGTALFDPYYLKSLIEHITHAYHFIKDEDGNPKYRFRYTGDRLDLIMYLSSSYDCRNLLSQGQIFFDARALYVSRDNHENDNSKSVFTFDGNEVFLQNSINIQNRGANPIGKNDFIQMSGGMCNPTLMIQA